MTDDPRELPPGAPRGEPVSFDFEGRTIRAFKGEPVAVALWAAGVRLLGRSPKFHRPRGLFCLEGHCASCYLRIEGRPNRRSCMTPATNGLRCERQNAFPDADLDVLRAADWLFPKGMDHHHLMTGTRVGNELFLKMVRQMGGSGTLPDAAVAAFPPIRDEAVDFCIVGAGPAGLGAARTLAEARPDARILVIDEQDVPGGSLLAEPGGVKRGTELAQAVRRLGIRLWLSSTAIAYYPEDGRGADRAQAAEEVRRNGPPGVLAVVTPEGLVRLVARRFLYATGTYDQNLAFPDNDRPGIISARACGRLIFRWGMRPAKRVLILHDSSDSTGAPLPLMVRLESELTRLGIPVSVASVDQDPKLDVRNGIVAVAALPTPASELARHHGARVAFHSEKGGFAVEVDSAYRTSAPGVFAAGDVTGYHRQGPAAAGRDGEAAGRALAVSD